MWRRASAKLLSLRSVARPNHIVTSSPWSAILRPSATIVARHSSGTVFKILEDLTPNATGLERVEPEEELVGEDLVDHDFLNGPFGTKESPAVMRSYYDEQVAGCKGPEGAPHATEMFWLKNGELHACPVCSQYFTLKCVGAGGIPLPEELGYLRPF